MKYKRTRLSLPLTILVCLLVLGVDPNARAQAPNQVGLVVQFGDGTTFTRCVAFTEPEISGYDVLQRSGLETVASFDAGIGAGVCAIDGEGCGAEDCFCQCRGSTCVYWSYWHLDGGAWNYSSGGASSYKAHNGDVEGWRWGEGEPPPVIPFDQICAPPPTDTPVPPTATPPPPPATATSPPPPEAWFRLDQNPIAAGSCTAVRWDTGQAQAVYLDGESVAFSGFREVCPTAPQTYRLRVVGAETEATFELVLGVTGATPSAVVPTLPPPTLQAEPQDEAVATSSPTTDTVSAGPSPSPTLSPSPSPPHALTSAPEPTARMTPATSAAPTPTAIAEQPTPLPVARVAPTSAIADLLTASGEEPSSSPLVPLGYAVFVLAVGSLLGWLFFEMRQRG